MSQTAGPNSTPPSKLSALLLRASRTLRLRCPRPPSRKSSPFPTRRFLSPPPHTELLPCFQIVVTALYKFLIIRLAFLGSLCRITNWCRSARHVMTSPSFSSCRYLSQRWSVSRPLQDKGPPGIATPHWKQRIISSSPCLLCVLPLQKLLTSFAALVPFPCPPTAASAYARMADSPSSCFLSASAARNGAAIYDANGLPCGPCESCRRVLVPPPPSASSGGGGASVSVCATGLPTGNQPLERNLQDRKDITTPSNIEQRILSGSSAARSTSSFGVMSYL